MCLSVPDPHAMVLVGTAFQSIGLDFGFGSAAGVSAARPERTTVLVSGDGAELHQYAAKGLHSQAMLIDQVDFATVGRALGAEGSKARTLSDLRKLEEWLAGHDDGVFVLDVAISQKVVAEYMRESVAAKG